MCKFCEENYEIDTMVGERQVFIKLDEEEKSFIEVRIPFGFGGVTKPMQINYCPFCGKSLRGHNIEDIAKNLNDNKECLRVKDLKEFIADKSDNMEVYITSNDEMPVRKLIDISSEEKTGYYSELYLDTVEC